MKKEIKDFLVFLEDQGCKARLVGGAVRDFFLGLPPRDIDIAYILKDLLFPEGSVILFNPTYKNFKVNWKGITLSLSALRKDILCDGRQAIVDFDASWEDDANRRDFSMNALYMDKDEVIFDPLGYGLSDLKKKKVRFIGDPHARISEDYLRLWRYYRFSSFYSGEKEITPHDFDQKKKHSPERVREEFFQILMSPRANDVLPLMESLLFHHFEASHMTMNVQDQKNLYERLYDFYPDIERLSAKCALRRSEKCLLRQIERISKP